MTDPTDPNAGPPVPPPARPPVPGPPPGSFNPTSEQVFDLSASHTPAASNGSKFPARIVAGGIGVLMLGGGTVFALTSAGDSGPESPEEAMDELFEAVANQDVLGVLGALDPAERDAVREPLQQMSEELTRLEILSEDFDLASVQGFDFTFEGVVYDVDLVRDDLARVRITEGEASVEVRGEDIPLGDFVLDTVNEFDGDVRDLDTESASDVSDNADDFIVAHDTSDGWRISFGYTAAEQARDDSGERVPDVGDGIEAVGADSPAEAVEEMIRSAAAFDFEDVIARLSSDMQPLREYSVLYEDELRSAEDEARRAGFDIDINSIDLEANESGSTALVQVTGIDASITADGLTLDFVADGECFEIDGDLDEIGIDLRDTPFENGRLCTDDLEELSADGFGDLEDVLGDEGIDIPEFPPFNSVDVGIVAVKENGKWFVSPIRTSLDLSVKGLQTLEREHLDGIVDLATQLVGTIEDSFTTFDDDFSTTFDDDFGTGFDDEFPPFEDDFDTGFDDDFDFTLDFDQFVLDAFEQGPCILDAINELPAEVQADIRGTFESGAEPNQQSDDLFSDIVFECGEFG